MEVGYVDKPDPINPVGARGVGEPLMGCAASALLSAVSRSALPIGDLQSKCYPYPHEIIPVFEP